MKHYNQTTPPEYDLSAIQTPIAMFGGETDHLADQQDVEWTHGQLNHTTIFYKQYPLGHLSFAIAKDMSYFTRDVMAIVNTYNGKDTCGQEFEGTYFEQAREKCLNETI